MTIHHPEYYLKVMDKANAAADEVCRQWLLLEAIPNLTANDLTAWLAGKEAYDIAQAEFEELNQQLYG